MRILLDECVPARLGQELVGHEVRTVPEMAGRRRRTELSWLRISYQQAVSKFAIALVVLVARRNKIEFLLRLLPELRLALPSVKPGQVHRVGG